MISPNNMKAGLKKMSNTIFMDIDEKLIRSLSPCFPLYAASNGIKDVQISRLKNAGLFPFFAGIFVSDDIGFEKPDIRFFKVCLSQIRRFRGHPCRMDIGLSVDGGNADTDILHRR